MAMTSWSKHSPCVRQGSVCHQQHPVSDLKAARQEGGGRGGVLKGRKETRRQTKEWVGIKALQCSDAPSPPHTNAGQLSADEEGASLCKVCWGPPGPLGHRRRVRLSSLATDYMWRVPRARTESKLSATHPQRIKHSRSKQL